MKIVFIGADSAAFFNAVSVLGDEGHQVTCFTNPFKGLMGATSSAPDVAVVDASRLDDQMLEVFEALKEAMPAGMLLAAVTPASRGRTAKILNLGSDAVIALPADPEEIQALLL